MVPMSHSVTRHAALTVAALLAATLLSGLLPGTARASVPSSWETTMTWGGHAIPVNPATGQQGIGTVCVEMHLATDAKSPFAPGAYQEIQGLSRVHRYGDVYGNYSSQHYMTPQRSSGAWPGGAFGRMTPGQEQWYLTMRWTYATWVSTSSGTRAKKIDWPSLSWHLKHRKVLVTNLSNGLQAVGYMGESGPGLGLGTPSGNRIGGLSPDLMYYLSNQAGEGTAKTTPFGADNGTEYRFEWLTDQSVPLGPVAGHVKLAPLSKVPAQKVPAKDEGPAWSAVPDSRVTYHSGQMDLVPLAGLPLPWPTGTAFTGGNAVIVTADGISPVTEWTSTSIAVLHAGDVYPLLEQSGEWYRVQLSPGQDGWLPVSAGTLVEQDSPLAD